MLFRRVPIRAGKGRLAVSALLGLKALSPLWFRSSLQYGKKVRDTNPGGKTSRSVFE